MSKLRARDEWMPGPELLAGGDAGGAAPRTEALREIIRAEVDRARPIEEARRSIELIAETSIRCVERDGDMVVLVVDEQGVPRTVTENGITRNLTVGELIEEIRSKHPKLFQEGTSRDGPSPSHEPSPAVARQEEPPDIRMPQTTFPFEPSPRPPAEREPGRARDAERDWLLLTPSTVTPRAALTTKLRDLEQGRWQREAPGPDRKASPFDGLILPPQPIPEPHPIRAEKPRGRQTADLVGDLNDIPEPRPWRVAAMGLLLLLLGGGALVYWGIVPWPFGETPTQEIAETAPEPSPESAATSSIQPPAVAEQAAVDPKPDTAGPLQGVPEVLDTATLYLQGKIVPLFGVEWVRGAGAPEDLARYINGREVVCEEAATSGTYRCRTGTQDLSKVVLYNGGGRAKSDATPELKAAESAARNARRGLWAAERVGAQP